jgi:hypothetical protein
MPAGNPAAYARLAQLAQASQGGTPEPTGDPSAVPAQGPSLDQLLAAIGKSGLPPALLLQLLAMLSGASMPQGLAAAAPPAPQGPEANPILAALLAQQQGQGQGF